MTKLSKKWTQGKFERAHFGFAALVNGIVNGPFGIYYTNAAMGWVITHIPTGWRIGGVWKSRLAAKKCVEQIAPRHDFERIKKAPIKRPTRAHKETVRIINRMCSA